MNRLEISGIGNAVFISEVLERGPELRRLIRPDKLAEHLINEIRRIAAAESEHVVFGVEPVAEIRPADEKAFAFPVQKLRAGCAHKRCGLTSCTRNRSGQNKHLDSKVFHFTASIVALQRQYCYLTVAQKLFVYLRKV